MATSFLHELNVKSYEGCEAGDLRSMCIMFRAGKRKDDHEQLI